MTERPDDQHSDRDQPPSHGEGDVDADGFPAKDHPHAPETGRRRHADGSAEQVDETGTSEAITEIDPALSPSQPGSPVMRQPAAPPHSEGMWAIVGREFRRRKLAVFSVYLLILLTTASIFAPFLANDMPIAYRGFNRFDYRESLRTVRGLLGHVTAMEPAEQKDTLRIIRQRIAVMRGQVDDELADDLALLRDEIEQAVETGDVAAIDELRSDLRRRFDARRVALTPGWHFPVLESLTWLDVLFMVLNLIFLAGPLWGMALRWWAPHRPGARSRFALALYFVLPTLCAAVWWLLVPERVDRSPYKEGALAQYTAAAEQAPVVYTDVLWPPIPYGVDEDNLYAEFAAPYWWESADTEQQLDEPVNGLPAVPPHWLGTDGIGRDVMCRMIWGGRVSLAVGVVAVSIYVTIGIVLGSLAGYFRGITDILISRVIEVVICFPSFFLILTIISFVGPSIFNVMVVIGLTGWTGVARLVRGEFLRLGEQDFVQAGRALGYSPVRIIFRHVLPNSMAPVLVAATFGIAGAILTESGLSFLGFGITVPKPSWGGILSTGRSAIFRAPWLIYFPGIAIFLTITAYNLVGDAFRDAADPRLREGRA